MVTRYGVIIADPPWANHHLPRTLPYPTLKPESLCALPIADIAAEKAVLLLWTTMPMITEGIDVIRAWGFTYVTAFPWIKLQGNPQMSLTGEAIMRPAYGIGFWARGCSELVMIGRRGQMPAPASSFIGLLSARFEHSRKPDNLYDYAEQFPGPYLELFARRSRSGWDAIGNEIDGRDIRDVLAVAP